LGGGTTAAAPEQTTGALARLLQPNVLAPELHRPFTHMACATVPRRFHYVSPGSPATGTASVSMLNAWLYRQACSADDGVDRAQHE